MAPMPRPADAIVLTVRNRLTAPDEPRRHELRHFTAVGQTEPPPTLLHGFSLGSELAGLPHGADEGLQLVSEADVVREPSLGEPQLRGPLYRLRLTAYLERLRREKINYLKVLVFDEHRGRHSPYTTDVEGERSRDLVTGISSAYLARLEELVRAARERGIVVVLSLFSSRMLRAPGWDACPFNARNNNTGHRGSRDRQGGQGDGAFLVGSPLELFCVVREPPPGRPFQAMSTAEKMWVVERELVTSLVTTVRRYWNVVFELCDDPRGPGEPGEMAEVIPWHVTVAGWLGELLRDRRGRRRRCLQINASAKLRGALLDALGAREGARGESLVDLVHLRGGDWGGYPGSSSAEAGRLDSAHEPGKTLFSADAIGGGIDHRQMAWPGIDAALAALDARPVVSVLDTDGHHLAQKLPRPYLEAARARRAHFLYRWPAASLHCVDVARESYDELGSAGQVCPARGRAGRAGCVTWGLEQRLGQLAAPEGSQAITAFPLPPPAAAPQLLTAGIAGDFLELTFRPPVLAAGEDAPEGYAVFVGASADEVWQGTDLFPDPLPVELTPAGGRVRLPPITARQSLFVSLAVTRGVLTSDLSEPIGPLELIPTGSALVAGELADEVEGRHDLRATFTFANTSSETWRGPEMGVLVQLAPEGEPPSPMPSTFDEPAMPGLNRLFFPLNAANAGELPQGVPPGEKVQVTLRQMLLEGPFDETYGALVPALLPYARRRLLMRVGMAHRRESARPASERPEVVFVPVGEIHQSLPDGRPLAVRVREPRRLGIRFVPESQQQLGGGVLLPLADGVDRGLHLVSVTAGRGAPGTVIRSEIALERLASSEGPATRLARIVQDRPGDVTVSVEIVKLHAIDVFHAPAGRAIATRALSLGPALFVPGLPLSITEGFPLSVVISTSSFARGPAIAWETVAGSLDEGASVAGTTSQLRNVSRASADVRLFTTELRGDDLSASVKEEEGAPDDPRRRSGSITFAVGQTVAYLPLEAADTHRFHVHRVRVQGSGLVRSAVVLRADEAGVFQRVLELRLEGARAATVVAWELLEIAVEASPAVNRTPEALHPLLAARIVAFFNAVTTPAQIVETIRDNRAFRRDTKRAYAVRPKLAAAILAARKTLPEGRFQTVTQLADIPGVGPDTFEDIAMTFEDDGTPTRS